MQARLGRFGFSLMEVLIALAIIAVLSGVIFPMIMVKVQDARRAALSQTLVAISQGVAEYRKAVTRYPPTLQVLTQTPVAGVTTDACGGTNFLAAINVANWRGPYLSREMLASGLSMADGVIQNSLRRVAASSTSLLIDVAAVERRVATDMDAEFDGTPADSTGGTIRYTPNPLPSPSTVSSSAPSGTVNLSYAIPISGC